MTQELLLSLGASLVSCAVTAGATLAKVGALRESVAGIRETAKEQDRSRVDQGQRLGVLESKADKADERIRELERIRDALERRLSDANTRIAVIESGGRPRGASGE